MLGRIYIDNYRCFVNYEQEFNGLNLLLGANGTGKSTLFEVLDLLRHVIAGRRDVTPMGRTCTRWEQRQTQTFELDVRREQGAQTEDYRYHLEIEYDEHRRRCRIAHERLTCEGRTLYESAGGKATLHRDDGSRGPEILVDWSRSGVSVVQPSEVNTKLCWFRDFMARVIVLRPVPGAIVSEAAEESEHLALDAGNFAAWYRSMVQERFDAVMALNEALGPVVDGFQNLALDRVGESARRLVVRSTYGSPRTTTFGFGELSDGQRMLVILYAVLRLCGGSSPTLLCIDEPDNYVALAELEPWIRELEDQVEAAAIQALLISHHPELLDDLAGEHGVIFRRMSAGPVRSAAFVPSPGLPPSEQIARGWDDG